MREVWFVFVIGALLLEGTRGHSATTAFVNSTNWSNSPEWATVLSSQNLEAFESVPVGTSFSSRNFDSLGANPTNRMSIQITQGGNLLVQTNALGGLLGQGGTGAFLTVPKPDANPVAFEISFSQAVRAISFFLGDYGDGVAPLNLLIRDENNVTLWSSSSPGNSYAGQSLSGLGASSWGFLGFTRPEGLTRLTFSASGTAGDNFALDTIRYSTIPEPSALVLLAVSFGGLVMMRYRQP